jgi:GT2 family glycosyltransferase
VDHVIGAYYLIRRPLFEEMGGFDTRFFVYFEDLDLSLRVAKAGWQTQYLACAAAYHEGGGSSKRIKATRLFYACRSRIQMAWKHLPRVQAIGIAAAVLAIEPTVRVVESVARRDVQNAASVVRGTLQLWRWVMTTRTRPGEPWN